MRTSLLQSYTATQVEGCDEATFAWRLARCSGPRQSCEPPVDWSWLSRRSRARRWCLTRLLCAPVCLLQCCWCDESEAERAAACLALPCRARLESFIPLRLAPSLTLSLTRSLTHSLTRSPAQARKRQQSRGAQVATRAAAIDSREASNSLKPPQPLHLPLASQRRQNSLAHSSSPSTREKAMSHEGEPLGAAPPPAGDQEGTAIHYVSGWPHLSDTQLAVIVGANVGSFLLICLLLRIIWKPPTEQQVR